jgi:hypothetical protein
MNGLFAFDASNNIITLKKKFAEIYAFKKNLANILLYVLILFIILVFAIIVYIATYNRKWLARVKISENININKLKPTKIPPILKPRSPP